MANMRAKVELLGSETHTGRGRTIERGKPVILTNPSDIRYYQAQGGFSVTILEDASAKPAAKPVKGGKPAKPAPPPVEEDSDDDDSDDDDSDADDDSDDGEGEGSEDGDSEDSEDGEASPVYKKAQLEALTKPALVELAKDSFGLELNAADSKGKLVAAILKEQIARANG
jgi:hypothetical protein